jgi:hypothetical protein
MYAAEGLSYLTEDAKGVVPSRQPTDEESDYDRVGYSVKLVLFGRVTI